MIFTYSASGNPSPMLLSNDILRVMCDKKCYSGREISTIFYVVAQMEEFFPLALYRLNNP